MLDDVPVYTLDSKNRPYRSLYLVCIAFRPTGNTIFVCKYRTSFRSFKEKQESKNQTKGQA